MGDSHIVEPLGPFGVQVTLEFDLVFCIGGEFYDGIYLKHTDIGVVSTKRVLSIGGSVDWQRNLNVVMDPVVAGAFRDVDSRSDYLAAAGDLFLDIPLDPENIAAVNGQVNFYYYNYGDRTDGDTHLDIVDPAYRYTTGIGISSEFGLRYDAFQPLFLFDFYDATETPGDMGDLMGIYGGFNYWLFAHAASFKFQAGAAKVNGGKFTITAALQAQLLF